MVVVAATTSRECRTRNFRPVWGGYRQLPSALGAGAGEVPGRAPGVAMEEHEENPMTSRMSPRPTFPSRMIE